MSDPIRVFIGYDPCETEAWAVCAYSIRRHEKGLAEIHKLDRADLAKRGLFTRQAVARGDLISVPAEPCVLASHRQEERASPVVQLTPLLGALLERCDGRPAQALSASLGELVPPPAAELLVVRGLPVLVAQGLVAPGPYGAPRGGGGPHP